MVGFRPANSSFACGVHIIGYQKPHWPSAEHVAAPPAPQRVNKRLDYEKLKSNTLVPVPRSLQLARCNSPALYRFHTSRSLPKVPVEIYIYPASVACGPLHDIANVILNTTIYNTDPRPTILSTDNPTHEFEVYQPQDLCRVSRIREAVLLPEC